MRTLVLLICLSLLGGSAIAQKNCDPKKLGYPSLTDLGPDQKFKQYYGGLYPTDLHPDTIARRNEQYDIYAKRVQPINGRILTLAIGNPNGVGQFNYMVDSVRKHPKFIAQNTFVNLCGPKWNIETFVSKTKKLNGSDSVSKAINKLGYEDNDLQVIWMYLGSSTIKPDTFRNIRYNYLDLTTKITSASMNLRSRFPNLKFIFISSQVYAGYVDVSNTSIDSTLLSTNDYYSAWSIRQVVYDQYQGAGSYGNTFFSKEQLKEKFWPLVAATRWAVDNWSDGNTTRKDGLEWLCEDFEADGWTLAPLGIEKAGKRLAHFFLTDTLTKQWMLDNTVDVADFKQANTIEQHDSKLILRSDIPTSYAVYNLSGVLMESGLVDGILEINLSNYANGLYVLEHGLKMKAISVMH